MPDLGGALSSLVELPHKPKLAKVFLAAVDLAPGEDPPFGTDNIAIQYWPESLQDTRPVEWAPRQIPGGSHPIYQWTHGGERKLSFAALFTNDIEPTGETSLVGEVANAIADGIGLDSSSGSSLIDAYGNTGGSTRERDRDIPASINWLRYFTYPFYGSGEDIRVFEPPKIILCFPGSRLAHTGEEAITTVMTQCDITYEAWYPSGFPRIVEVQLEFAEVVQTGQAVRFHNRKDMILSAAARTHVVPGDDGVGGGIANTTSRVARGSLG